MANYFNEQILGESIDTIKSRHRRALMILRKTLCQTAKY